MAEEQLEEDRVIAPLFPLATASVVEPGFVEDDPDVLLVCELVSEVAPAAAAAEVDEVKELPDEDDVAVEDAVEDGVEAEVVMPRAELTADSMLLSAVFREEI